jgi:hypothetical protein
MSITSPLPHNPKPAQIPTLSDSSPAPDLPPAYTPHDLPPYTHADITGDRGRYALAIMHHNLRHNTHVDLHRHSEMIPLNPSITRTRAQRAALRDYQASQDPNLWGRRVGHGRRARMIQEGTQGFWAWLGSLFVDEERGREVILSAGSPWSMIGPTGIV